MPFTETRWLVQYSYDIDYLLSYYFEFFTLICLVKAVLKRNLAINFLFIKKSQKTKVDLDLSKLPNIQPPICRSLNIKWAMTN